MPYYGNVGEPGRLEAVFGETKSSSGATADAQKHRLRCECGAMTAIECGEMPGRHCRMWEIDRN